MKRKPRKAAPKKARKIVLPNRREWLSVGIAVCATLLLVGLFNLVLRPSGAPGPFTPKGEGKFVVVVVDDKNPTIQTAKVIDGPTIRELKAAGRCRVYGNIETADKAKAYRDYLAGEVPGVIVVRADGGPVAKAKLQHDDVAFAAWVKPLMEKVNPPPKAQQDAEPGTVQTDPVTGRQFIDTWGSKRWLTSKPSDGKMKALPKYGDHEPVFPRSEWYEMDRTSIFGGEDWTYDQNGHGSCVANGWCGALRRARVLAGMKDVKLSCGFLYSLINGNQDQGAIISDGIGALTKVGTCTFQLVGQDPIYQRQMPKEARAEAARFKLLDAYHCDTYDETVSAILTGRFIAVYGMQVGNNFQRFDPHGVAGHSNGPGNHCMMADGVRKLPDGRWVIDNQNSWNFRWGPFHNGRCFLDEKHLFAGGNQADVCVVRVAATDPKEPYEPPALKF